MAMMMHQNKHYSLMRGPIGERPVRDLLGIGEILGQRLVDLGFDKAYKVVGQFLLLGKDSDKFTKWLEGTIGANSQQARHCVQCLKEWCDYFM